MQPVIILIAINVVAFFLPYLINFSGPSSDSFMNFVSLGWKNNADIRDGEYYRLLTSTFLHGDFFHLLFNMYALWSIGPTVLTIFQPLGFMLIYLLSGISGSLASYLFNPTPSIGASGAIFGLIGALFAVAIVYKQPGLLSQLFIILVINFIYALDPVHRIDNFGHLGGLLMGFLVGMIFLVLKI
jgi:rhomboid protease GluP